MLRKQRAEVCFIETSCWRTRATV